MVTMIFQLKLILWKNCMIRRHHCILTILEIAVPILLFLYLAYARNNVDFLRPRLNTDYIDHPTYPSLKDSDEIYQHFYHDICYAPKTEFTSKLIKKVQSKLRLRDEAVKGFKSEFDLVKYYESVITSEWGWSHPFTAVVFKNVSGQPNHLKYIIKPSRGIYRIEELFRNGPYDPNSDYEFLYGYFQDSSVIALQMALDTSYIEITSERNLPVVLTMQELPYPPHYNEEGIQNLFVILRILTLFGFILLFPFVLQRVMDEKITGIKELMKMMGLKSWMLWLGWYLHAFMANIISILLITYVMKTKVFGADQPMIRHCSPSVFAVFLVLYCATLVTFAFMISSFFNRPTLAIIVGISIWMVSAFFPSSPKSKPYIRNFYAILFPTNGLKHGYAEISQYELRGVGVDWGNLFKSASTSSKDITLGQTFIMFIISSVIFMLLTMYMEIIMPGPHGVAKPPHFPALYIWSKISRSNKVEDEEASGFENNANIEKPPNLETGVTVKNLYKKFGRYTAVDNLSIDIYEGQITALLGRNGAGKTTTMSIITGMTSATSGKVFINNQDIKYHMNKIRSSLGFCPQSNLQFRDLNVNEHLIFFAMLKGSSYRSAQRQTKELLERLNLSNKQYNAASTLSGGMKRRLSLGMALIGNSKVLILDEPTSGLDPEARREIWDILLGFRGSRTIIITTHFMEEADVLGDRVAIIDHGRLMCYGTSMYLKKQYGSGYNLTLVRDEEAFKARKSEGVDQVEAITSLVRGKIKSATLLSASGNRVIIVLPHDMKPSFGELLGAVESRKEELCITNIALSATTLEEVFLNVHSSVAEEANRDKPNDDPLGAYNIAFVTNPSAKHTGCKLLTMQLWILFQKRWWVLKRAWMLYVSATMIAVAAAVLTVHFGQEDSYSQEEKFDFHLSNYGKTTVVCGAQQSDTLLANIQRHYKQLVKSQGSTPNEVKHVSDMLISSGKNNIVFYKYFMVVAAEFNVSGNSKIVNAMYSQHATHATPISLNLVTNAILKTTMSASYSISTSISPISDPNVRASKSSMKSIEMWFLLFPLGVLFLAGTFLMFPHMEKTTNVKQLQLMCGVRAVSYWLVCYIFDIILYLVAVVLILIGILLYGTIGSKTFSGGNEIGFLLLLLLVYGLGIIPHVYLYTYKKTASGAFVWYFFANFLLGPILALHNTYGSPPKARSYILFLIPHVGLLCITPLFAQKAVWIYNWDKATPEEKDTICSNMYKPSPCCKNETTRKCIEYRSYLSPGGNQFHYYHLLIMAASSILYFVILLLLESNFVQKLWERLFVMIFERLLPKRKNVLVGEHDREDVITEMNRISDLLQQEKETKSSSAGELLLVHQLEKRFVRNRAVKGVSFAVKPGECFGLLGVNGAGKTTTFRILTGDLPLITGEARILTPTKERIYLSKQPGKYFKQVGYCPQFDAINEVLTGREMLKLFADLRGIREAGEEEINMWISILGLQEYADKPCGLYSGGNKRKLSVALTLIGAPAVVMLDEPTSGVDPFSRRLLWNTLSGLQKQKVKPSIILTSHSMEECEALCNNLVIMKAGQLECYGTIPNIKKKYAQGFTVLLKLKICSSKPKDVQMPNVKKDKSSAVSESQGQSSSADRKSVVIEDSKEVKNLMNEIETTYKGFCTLKDKHTGLLHYHINDKNKKWGQMFKEIAQLQEKHPIIEDYNISETTLEQVFLTIARSDD